MQILVTYAIPQEKVEIQFHDCTVRYCQTGVGKVNALLSVFEAVSEYKPDVVMNVGTAGSVRHDVDSIVICSRFVDRDMEKCKDFGVDYEHDFLSEVKKITLFTDWKIENSCNTGDSFVTEAIDNADAFDMENFAVAALCKRKAIPFLSVKYITDKIGENSVKHWEDKLDDANAGLQAFFNNL
ncbi:MAG: nucleosidase [Bacteroidales bacterium]|nr:nucleosidase [Bacteroidales bacterium]